MQNEVTIRPMEGEDAIEIHAIHTACLRTTLRAHYDEGQISAWTTGRTPAGYLRAQDGGEAFLVAVANGVVVGYVSWEDGELLSLFVRPHAQRTGIGTLLADAAFRAAETAGSPIVVLKAALGAGPFYERFGFEDSGPGSTIKRGVEIPDRRMRRQLPEAGNDGYPSPD
ncbi:Acetyltransferase [Bosea sp. LC85]|nr:Acetyltransferase [Bosea sp. LC85]